VIIYNGNPVWETIGIFPTQRACFAALEREQLANSATREVRFSGRESAPKRKSGGIRLPIA
jgi:hypothetical protein